MARTDSVGSAFYKFQSTLVQIIYMYSSGFYNVKLQISVTNCLHEKKTFQECPTIMMIMMDSDCADLAGAFAG